MAVKSSDSTMLPVENICRYEDYGKCGKNADKLFSGGHFIQIISTRPAWRQPPFFSRVA